MISTLISMAMLMAPAYAQECPEGCVPESECPQERDDTCALQAVPSEDSKAVEWVGVQGDWHGNMWWSTAQVSDDHPSVFSIAPTMAASSSNNHEQACSIATAGGSAAGAIVCYGNSNANGQTSGRPTGAEPYSSLAVGNVSGSSSTGQAWVALNASGGVVTWGNTSANGFNTARPSGTGFDAVAVGFGPVGCAVDSVGTGVSCWGNNTQSIVSGAPSSGSYKAVGIGRYTAAAVTTAGALTLWGATSDASFRSTWPGDTDVSEVFFTEASEHIGLAYHTDHTITVWQTPGAQQEALTNAPCGLAGCVTTGVYAWRSDVSFRTAPRLAKADAPASICGVIEYDPSGTYGCGDVVCWGHYAESTGIPDLIHECTDDTCF